MRLFIITLLLTVITTAAYAINPAFLAAVSGGGGAAGNPYDSATIILSANNYTSGQTWSNTGSAGTSCDSYLGQDGTADTTDPTFSTDEFQLDGGDYFQFINTSCATTNNAHMTGGTNSGARWFAFAFQLGGIDSTVNFFGSTGGAASNGFTVKMNTTENLRFQQSDGTSLFNQQIAPAETWAATTDYLLILTFDSTNTGSDKYWVNTNTGSAWENSYAPNTTSTASTNQHVIAALVGGSQQFPSGSKVYGFFAGDQIVDDTGAKSICESIETELNKDFDGNSTIGSCTN